MLLALHEPGECACVCTWVHEWFWWKWISILQNASYARPPLLWYPILDFFPSGKGLQSEEEAEREITCSAFVVTTVVFFKCDLKTRQWHGAPSHLACKNCTFEGQNYIPDVI